MKFLLVLLFICLMVIPVNASDWNKTDTAFQIVYTTLHFIDWWQTLDIARNPDKWSETNPILGDHPSVGRVNAYFTLTLIGHTAISYILPKDYRRIWQVVWIGIEAGYVVHNYRAGIRIRF